MLRIALIGATGRMGRQILQQIWHNPHYTCVAAFSGANSLELGRDIGSFIGYDPIGVTIQADTLLAQQLPLADVLLDFSVAESVVTHLECALALKKPTVIGVTGLSSASLVTIQQLVNQIPIIHEANYSIAMHVMMQLVEKAVALLTTDFDIQISENAS